MEQTPGDPIHMIILDVWARTARAVVARTRLKRVNNIFRSLKIEPQRLLRDHVVDSLGRLGIVKVEVEADGVELLVHVVVDREEVCERNELIRVWIKLTGVFFRMNKRTRRPGGYRCRESLAAAARKIIWRQVMYIAVR